MHTSQPVQPAIPCSRLDLRMHSNHLLVWVLVAGSGCQADEAVPQTATASDSELTEVCRLAAELLRVPQERMNPDVPLSEHDPPMDDLDLVELVLELEDHFQVTIPDEELVRAAGDDGVGVLPSRLSLASMAEIVRQVRTQTDR